MQVKGQKKRSKQESSSQEDGPSPILTSPYRKIVLPITYPLSEEGQDEKENWVEDLILSSDDGSEDSSTASENEEREENTTALKENQQASNQTNSDSNCIPPLPEGCYASPNVVRSVEQGQNYLKWLNSIKNHPNILKEKSANIEKLYARRHDLEFLNDTKERNVIARAVKNATNALQQTKKTVKKYNARQKERRERLKKEQLCKECQNRIESDCVSTVRCESCHEKHLKSNHKRKRALR